MQHIQVKEVYIKMICITTLTIHHMEFRAHNQFALSKSVILNGTTLLVSATKVTLACTGPHVSHA